VSHEGSVTVNPKTTLDILFDVSGNFRNGSNIPTPGFQIQKRTGPAAGNQTIEAPLENPAAEVRCARVP